MDMEHYPFEMPASHQKTSGAYYTPAAVAASLVKWVIRRPSDRLLDPSCGDGRFISRHANSTGVEQSGAAARAAKSCAPFAQIHRADFFVWAGHTEERFECAAGNPPFIRYQTFSGETRNRALEHCRVLGVQFSKLTSSWAPFLVVAASLLKPGGRMAFVVPAEIGHAPYAAPLLEYIVGHFAKVEVIAVRGKIFPDLSEDCWLLYAEGFGGSSSHIGFAILDAFSPSASRPRIDIEVPVSDWRELWKRRLRPFLMPARARELYREVASRPDTRRFGDMATIGIGYVSGDNDFFHLRPSVAADFQIPGRFLLPTVRNGRALSKRHLTYDVVEGWRKADEPILLLNIPRHERSLPRAVLGYLDTEQAHRAKAGYKCRNREPWYSVPDVKVPDLFLTYMSGREAALVRNDAACTCTNSVHSVKMKRREEAPYVLQSWASSFAKLSCEIEGHPLGGGMLKLEPREAVEIVLPSRAAQRTIAADIVNEAVAVMRSWRHCGA